MALIGHRARIAALVAALLLAGTGSAEAQSPGDQPPGRERWNIAALVSLAPGAEEIFRGGWAFSAARRLTRRLDIAAIAGRQTQGEGFCNGVSCVTDPPAGFCPCEHPSYSSWFLAFGPRWRIGRTMFAQALAGTIAPSILSTRHFIVQPGVGWDFGSRTAAFRLEVSADVVPGPAGLFNLWGRAGLVIRIGAP